MRIVLDGRTIADHFPGIGRYTYNLASALADDLSPADELVLLHDSRRLNTHFDLAALGAHANLRLFDVQARIFSVAEQLRLPAQLRRLGATVYHSPYYRMPYRPGCPSVVTVHDLIPMRYPDYYSAAARLIFALTVRLAVRAARRVVAVSQAGANDLQELLELPHERLATVPEAPDPIFKPQPAEAVARVRARYELPAEYLLYFGSNKPHKNLPRLVRAFAQLAPTAGQAPLIIAGHWDKRYPQARQAAEALSASVKFIGPVAQADLPALYAGATLFAFPSMYEGFGLPPLEAMACGVPVACSNTSSLPEVVGEAALTFDPLDEAAMTAALAQGLNDAALRDDLRSRGLARAAQFTWARAAQQTFEIYHSLEAAHS